MMDRDESEGGSAGDELSAATAEPARPSSTVAPSPEDLICLQSVIDELRRERESLIRRLQAAESGAREKVQLSESRLREALAQIDALKRNTQTVRARLEAEVQAAKKRGDQAVETLERQSAEAERLRIANAELTTVVDVVESRLADLETESGIHQQEIARLEGERAADAEHAAAQQAELTQALDELRRRHADLEQALAGLQAERCHLQAAFDDVSDARAGEARRREELEQQVSQMAAEVAAQAQRAAEATRARGELEQALATARADADRRVEALRAVHAEELSTWHDTAAQREAELVAARDDLARQIEQEQSQTILAREEVETLGQCIRGLEAEAVAATHQRQDLEQELAAAREDRAHELAVFEAAAREREETHRAAIETLRTTLQGECAAWTQRATAAETERDAALRRCAALEQDVCAATAEWERVQCDLDTRGEAERALTERLAATAEAVRQRDARIDEVVADGARLAQQCAELQAGADAARARELDWRAAQERAQEEIEAARGELMRSEAFTEAARAQIVALEAQLAAVEGQLAERDAQSGRLSNRILSLEQGLRQGSERLTQLDAEAEQLRQRHAAELHAAAEAARRREEGWRATQETLAHDIATARGECAESRAALDAARAHVVALEAQLAEDNTQRGELSGRIVTLEDHLRARAARVEQLEAAHAAAAEELTVWQQTAAQREAELVAAREELAAQLAQEQSQHAAARERADTLAERVRTVEAEVLAAHQQHAEIAHTLDQAHADLASRDATIEAAQQVARGLEARLAQGDAEESALAGRITALEADLRQRDARLAQLGAEADLLRQRHGEELNAWQEAAVHREAESVAARDELAARLAQEQSQAHAARDEVSALGERLGQLEADRQRALQQRQELDQQLAAVLDERAALAVRAQQLGADGETLAARVALLEQETRQRSARIAQFELEAEQLRTQHAVELQAARDTHHGELEAARTERETDRAALQAVQAQLGALQAELAARAAALNDLRDRTDAAGAVSREHRDALAAATQREAMLQNRCAELARHLEDVQEQTVGALQAQETMGAQIETLSRERHELLVRIDEMTALTGQLERECERLRRDRPAGEEARRQKAELQRVEAKIADMERQHAEAAQRHSAAVAGYMVELNQRSEALHARNLEGQKLAEELAVTKQLCDDTVAQLEAARQERQALERELAELRTAAANGGARAAAKPAAPAATAASARPAVPKAGEPSAPLPASKPAGGPVTLIHLEDNKAFRDPVREVLGRLPESRYLNAMETERPAGPGARMLAVNLLNRAQDPLAAIAASAEKDDQDIFAYCADGSSGFSFGRADFFAQPIDPDACVTRLIERRGTVQRLLAVSENIEMTGALREVLSRMRCSTSVAFDVRQAIDLLPMIKPDVVLVDFSLPRGEGVRLVSRLRSDPKTRELALAVLLPAAPNVAEFRQHALRAARELPMSPSQLAQALGRRLGAPAPAAAPAKGNSLQQTG